VVVATGVVAGAFATQVDWAAPVDRAQVPGPTLAGPSSPVVRGSIRLVAMPVTHATPAVEEIPTDVDTTGLLQSLDAVELDEAAAGITDDVLQGD
jgi:hypothetical protein